MSRLAELKRSGNDVAVLEAERKEAATLKAIVGSGVHNWIGALSTIQASDNTLAGAIIVVRLSCGSNELTFGSVPFSEGTSGAGNPPALDRLNIGNNVSFSAEPDDNLWDLAQNEPGPREFVELVAGGHFAFRFSEITRVAESSQPE